MIGEEVIAIWDDGIDGAELYEVQKLVRCKDCMWRDKDNQGEDYCTYVKGLADINGDSFCSWGERADDEV